MQMSASCIISATQLGKHPRLNVDERTVRRWAETGIIPEDLLEEGPNGRNQFHCPTEEQVSEILARRHKQTGKNRLLKNTSTELRKLFDKCKAGDEHYTAVATAYSFLGNEPDIVETLLSLAEVERVAVLKGQVPFEECRFIMRAEEFLFRNPDKQFSELTAEQRYPSAFVDEEGILFNGLPGGSAIGFPPTHAYSQVLKDHQQLKFLVCCRRAARKNKRGKIIDREVARELGIAKNTFLERYKRNGRFRGIYRLAKASFDKDHLTLPTALSDSAPSSSEADDHAYIKEETTKGRIIGRGTKKPTHFRNYEES